MRHCSFTLGLLLLLFGFLSLSPKTLAQVVYGDRIVVSINNIPYTQRQIEVYIAVKESLRPSPRGESVRLVNVQNWKEAIAVFTDDMLILQEATRLGSFQTTDQNFDKYERVVRDKFKKDSGLVATSERLGIDDLTIAKSLETVLRVASYRRSKDRQAVLAKDGESADDELAEEAVTKKNTARWFRELAERAVIRRYQDATEYLLIQPTAGRNR
jgi:hypothetical protein